MDWHRLFGLILMDFFTGSPFIVELEKDLALKKQLLDVVVLRRGPGPFAGRLPDGTDKIRIIVAGQVSREPQNALLHLFSASAEPVGYGAGHYEQRSHDTSSLVGRLLGSYQGEGIAMSYTMADYRRDTAEEYLKELTPEEQREVLPGLTPE